jgi:hypothetical protein
MKKKLITILAMLAIGATFVFAADTTAGADPGTWNGATLTQADGESTVIVADADEEQYLFALEVATDDAATSWTAADTLYITDADWDVRTGFDVDFRIRATAGAMAGVSGLQTTLTISNLLRESDDWDAGAGTLSLSSNGSFMPTTLSGLVFSTTLDESHVYGVDATTAANATADSFVFNIDYVGNDQAPAGRYRSTVTVAYTVS